MARVKPCRRCGHSKTQHSLNNINQPSQRGRCKYIYAARNGRNLHIGIDTQKNGHWKQDENGRFPRNYQCLCPKWLPIDLYILNEETDELVFIGFEDGLDADGNTIMGDVVCFMCGKPAKHPEIPCNVPLMHKTKEGNNICINCITSLTVTSVMEETDTNG